MPSQRLHRASSTSATPRLLPDFLSARLQPFSTHRKGSAMRFIPIRSIRTFAFAAAAILLLAASSARAQDAAPKRPRITGISHVGYFVSDLPKAIAFWHDFLGYDESYDLKKVGSDTDVRIAFIKINDHQHIELFNEPPTAP